MEDLLVWETPGDDYGLQAELMRINEEEINKDILKEMEDEKMHSKSRDVEKSDNIYETSSIKEETKVDINYTVSINIVDFPRREVEALEETAKEVLKDAAEVIMDVEEES